MCATTAALTAFEVAVAGGGASFARSENVGVHAETHAATGLAPVESCRGEDLVEALFFSLRFDGLRARDDHRANCCSDVVTAHDGGCGAEVFDAGVGAGAKKDTIDLDLFDGFSRMKPHVFQRALEGLPIGLGSGGIREGNSVLNACHHAGTGSPTDSRRDVGGVDRKLTVEDCSFFGYKFRPVRYRFVPCGSSWREAAALEIGEGSGVGCDHAGTSSSLDAHIADGHAAFHREGADGRTCVLDDIVR